MAATCNRRTLNLGHDDDDVMMMSPPVVISRKLSKTDSQSLRITKEIDTADSVAAFRSFPDVPRPSVTDWGDGVSASCTVGPIVR